MRHNFRRREIVAEFWWQPSWNILTTKTKEIRTGLDYNDSTWCPGVFILGDSDTASKLLTNFTNKIYSNRTS